MTRILIRRSWITAASLFISGLLAGAASAEQELNPDVAAVGPASDVPVAIQNARWAVLDADINTLTFRSMDTLFTTRTVARSGPVTPLPHAERALDFTYSFQGQTYTPEAFLDWTYTNALLIMKDGKVVYENYRNNSGPETRFIGWSMTKSFTSVLIGCALAEGRIDSLDDDITKYLPALVFAEAANALWALWKRGDIGKDDQAEAINLLKAPPIAVPYMVRQLAASAGRLAIDLDHPVYDCFYLALALLEQYPVFSADGKFLDAVRAHPYLGDQIEHVGNLK